MAATARSLILGTAGHIDHGKTTLVKALTGTDTDRLKEEKERGITIELGFAHLDLPNGKRLGIVDVPGHERFVKNMVAGAMGMDVMALVVAADEGVMPQTREHLEICQLLGVSHGVIVLTKKDVVDEEWLELVIEDLKEFVKNTFLEKAPIVPVSSVTGEGIDRLVEILSELTKNIEPKSPSGPYRLPVDRIFTVKGFGTVVTGTSISGVIHIGDEVLIYPKGISSRIRGIQTHGSEATEAHPGMRTALNLQSVYKEDLERGDVLATPGSLHPSYLLDLHFIYLESAKRPLKYRSPVRFHAGTAEIIGRILLPGDEIEPGFEGYVQIKLERPVAVLPGDHYVLRSYSPIHTIGGGRIINPVPRRRKRTRPDLWKELEALAEAGPSERILLHLKGAGHRGLASDEISVRTGLYGKGLDKELSGLLSKKAVVKVESEGVRYIHAHIFEDLKQGLLDILAEFHTKNPLVKGLSKEEMRSKVFSGRVDTKLFHKALSELVARGKIAQDRDTVRLSTHKVALAEDQKRLRSTLEAIFLKAGLKPPSIEEALNKLSEDKDLAKEIITLLIEEGTLVRLKDDLFFHQKALDKAEKLVVGHIKKHGDLTVSDFRDLSGGLSRKYMIPILEYLDNKRVTIRIGDKRQLRG